MYRISPIHRHCYAERENMDTGATKEEEEEEESSNGPLTWNEFLSFLNPNYTPNFTPGQTPTQTPDQTLEPSKVNTGNPKPPFSTSSPTKKQDEQPQTRTVIPFDMQVPESGFATPGGISYMKSF